MNKFLRTLLAALLVTTSLSLVQAAPANAVAGPFSCTPDFYQASGGDMLHLDTSTFTYSPMTGSTNLNSFNAIGYNTADNYIYGISGGNLYRVYSDGSHSAAISLSGTPKSTGGTFIAGNRMLTNDTNGGFTTIDLTTTPPTVASFPDTGAAWGAADIAFDPGTKMAYGVGGNTLYIATFNAGLSTLNVTTKTFTNNFNSNDPWGAAYVDRAGNGYFFDNNTAELISVTAADMQGSATTITASHVASANTPSSPNDGASCPTASSPWAPDATTVAATSVTNTGATLNGSITTQARTGSNITTGNLQICYSTSATETSGLLSSGQTCANTTPATQALNLGAQSVSLALTGLTAGTTYYFQVIATDTNGNRGIGSVLNFQTTGGGSPSFTVTFDANSGSGTMGNQTSSTAAALTTNAYTRSGYSFGGWNDASNGSGTAYADGANYPFTASVTLYAQWTANTPAPTPPAPTYPVYFDGNGGGPNPPTQSYNSNICFALPDGPSRPGYTFVGWFVAPDAHSLLPSPYCPTGDSGITLYAHWTPNTYLLNYNSAGGSVVPSATYTHGSSVTLAGAPTKPGYTFAGWAVSPDGGATVASPYAAPAGGATLYARWTANNYVLKYDSQGGTEVPASTFQTGGSVNLAAAPTRPGYSFIGWFGAAKDGSPLASPHTPGVTNDVTVFAQWKPNGYKVTFDAQGGSPVADGTYQTAGCLDLPAAPARDGYTFTGWFAAATGGSSSASPLCPTDLGDLTLYAQWAKNPPVKRPPVTVTISGFADGSPVLTKAIKKQIDAFLKKYSDYKNVECIGYTEGPTVLKTDYALSRSRATNSCNYAVTQAAGGIGKSLRKLPSKAGQETVEASHLRRVTITLTD